jgi:hypothetical protein
VKVPAVVIVSPVPLTLPVRYALSALIVPPALMFGALVDGELS